jgi:hypothetical protein
VRKIAILHAMTRGREIAGAALVLAVAALVAQWPALGETGFYNDDWNYARTAVLAGGFGAAVGDFDYLSFRPLQMLYWPLAFRGLGTDFGVHQALLVAIAVLESVLVFALARRAGLERVHAGVAALLVLVSPAADATRFWPSMGANVLAVCAWLGGLLVALAGLRARGRRSWLLHGAALALYLTSILLYEIAASLIFVSGAAYVWRAGRRGLARWAIDAGLVLAVIVLVTRHTFYDPLPADEMPGHAVRVAREGAALFARSLWAPWDPGAVASAAVCLVAAVVIALGWRAGRRDRVALCLVAAAATAVAFVMLVPSADLSPGKPGQHNRGNVAAAVGLAVLGYAVLLLAVELVARRRATAIAVALGLVVAVGSVVQLRRDAAHWVASAAAQERILRAVGHPPTGATVVTLRAPVQSGPDVPVFAAVWDLQGALALRYDDPSLRAYPVPPGTRVQCGRAGLELHNYNDAFARQTARYADAVLVDVGGGRRLEPPGPRTCREAAALTAPRAP